MIQGYEGIPEDLTVKNFSRSWGINGAVQLTASIPNMIKDFEYQFLVGNSGEQIITEKIDKMAKASWVINSLKKARLAYLPGVFKGMHDNWDNNAKLESMFGVELDWLNFSDVVKEVKNVSDEDIRAEVLNMKSRYKVIEPQDVDLYDEARMYLGVKRLIKNKTGPVHLLDEISKAVPKDKLWLNSFQESKGILRLQGTAMDNKTVALFMINLEKSKYIQSVDLQKSQLAVMQGMNLSNFSLQCKTYAFKKPAPKVKKKKKKK